MTHTTIGPDHRCDIQDDRSGPVRVVRVIGRLDWATVDAFRNLMRSTTDVVLIVNLDRAELDASGTGVLMSSTARAKKRGQTLVFVVTDPIEVEVLQSLGLPMMASIVASEPEALALVS